MRRLSVALLLPAILLTAACGSASGARPAGVARPDIRVRQAGSIFFGSTGSAPVSIDVHITNNANVPLRVREVEIRSTGMMQYSVDRTVKIFNETLDPGQSHTFGLVATARTRQTRVPSSEPLAIQTVVRFEANGRGFREVVLEQFAGSGY